MIATTAPDFGLFDALILQDLSFSVFRLPNENSTTLVVQENGLPECLHRYSDLNGKEGFVVAPFEITEETPLILLHPDVLIQGETDTMAYLTKKTLPSIRTSETSQDEPPINSYTIYQKAFELFQNALCSNSCEKIVLSRTLDKIRPDTFSAGKTFKAACETYPEAFVYLCHTPITGTWLGSSPELILSGEKTNWQTVALAGTIKAVNSNELENLWDEKNIREQEIVSTYLGKQLEANELTYTKNGPFSAQAGKLLHLKTEFNFEMDGSSHIGDLLESLHPTPAVCGFPKKTTYRLILKKEGYKRKYYSGFIGPLSIDGRTDLFVNLRCMNIQSKTLTFYAGGGLLAGSDQEAEWQETEEKMHTLLSLIDF